MNKIIASTYEIIEKIGSGGGGVVYLANHLRLNKKVILKADKRKLSTKPELLRREVDILKNLSHSHIPQVYDFFLEDGVVYTAMEYIEGESLDKPLKNGKHFSQVQVIKWAKQLLEALVYLHSPIHGNPPRGYVHSDIKPANLMKTERGDICLIDFNITLALGEENVVGFSAGYSSPEHYGLRYITGSDGTIDLDNTTVTLSDETETLTLSSRKSTSFSQKVVPDVRSDIYSVGATLYHLLSGIKPEKDALKVIPLSSKDYSAQIVKIINKAMEPDPDKRFQSAKEMLDAFNCLHENDKRTKKFKKNNLIITTLLIICFSLGTSLAFIGLIRMNTVETWIKNSQYSKTFLENGNQKKAIQYALKSLPLKSNIVTPTAISQGQKALSDALGVYDLMDSYKNENVISLPKNPLCLKISPNGKYAACIYSKNLAILDIDKSMIKKVLPTDESALSEVEFLNDTTILYAGKDGLTSYDIVNEKKLWTKEKATAISISQNHLKVAAVYKNNSYALIYNVKNGEIIKKVDFNSKSQSVTINDRFANPNDNFFELNEDGTWLGISFSDGSLDILNLQDDNDDILIYDASSGFTHFEGGFYKNYMAFSATNSTESQFAVIDISKKEQTGGFNANTYFGTKTNENGIYVQNDNKLVKIDPISGNQTPLVTTDYQFTNYTINENFTFISNNKSLLLFDKNAKKITEYDEKQTNDFLESTKNIAIVGSLNSTKLKILKYKEYNENTILNYDALYDHDETRINSDSSTIMLFSYDKFRLYKTDGTIINETEIPNAKQVYDQQYRRKAGKDYLEVIYNDGSKIKYSALDGSIIEQTKGKTPDLSLKETFYTQKYKIVSPLHGSSKVYDRKTNKKICNINEDAYLIYIYEVKDKIIAQFMTTDGFYYGKILNDQFQCLGTLPYLSDVYKNKVYFDYPSGQFKVSKIYELDELILKGLNY